LEAVASGRVKREGKKAGPNGAPRGFPIAVGRRDASPPKRALQTAITAPA
jgi:hypothetical protein